MIETLKGLPLVANTDTPIPSAVASFYANTIAQGSGPNGTFLLTDLLGTAAGIPANAALTAANSIITARLADGTLSALDDIYGQMRSVITDVFGAPPSIVIPSGPAAGTYASYDTALAALITAADAAIGTAVTAMGDDAATLNSTWTAMAQNYAREQATQPKASIDFAIIPTDPQLPITAFIVGIDSFGQDTQQGMAAQFLESVANVTNQSGQALIGAMRTGRNTAALAASSIEPDSTVPDVPLTAPPQANLSSGIYTPAEARVVVQTNLAS